MGDPHSSAEMFPNAFDDLRVESHHGYAEISPRFLSNSPTFPLGLCRLAEELLGVVNRNGEGDARRDLHTVDTDGLSVQIDERTTRVPEGYSRVSLDILRDVFTPEPQLLVGSGDVADDSRGDGVGQRQGRAQSNDPLPWPRVLAAPELHLGQSLTVDPQRGQVRLHVHVLNPPGEGSAVLELHLNTVLGLVDHHVGVGEDKAVAGHNEAGAVTESERVPGVPV